MKTQTGKTQHRRLMHTTKLPGALVAVLGLHLLFSPNAQAQLVQLQQPTATYSQPGYEIGSAIDGTTVYPFSTPGGWGVLNGSTAGNETAVFETVSDMGFSNYTVLAFTLYQTHWNPQHTLGRFRLSVTTDARTNFADGLSTGGQIGSNWTVLVPRTTFASNGASLAPQADQAILAGGISPSTSTYIIEALTPLTNITGIRIEAIEHNSFPFQGPGREPLNGNFVLTEIQLRASAATNIYWTNTQNGTLNWSNPTNWSPNRLPTSTDHAHIVADGTYTVLQNVSATVLSLTLGGTSGTQTLVNSSATLSTANGKINPNGLLSLGGGIISGTNTILGTVDWVSGSLATTRLTVAPGGRLNISGFGTKSLTGTVTNAGIITWTNATLNFVSSSALYNLAGALFDVRSDSAINDVGSVFFIHNAGTFRKSVGTGTNLISPTFINHGTVEVLVGTLSFNGGGTNHAVFNVASGAAIQNPSGFTFATGSQLLGPGINRWTGGTITLDGDVNVANVEIAGATLAGAGQLSVSNLNFSSGTFGGTNTISGIANWTGGTIPSTARLTIATNGVLNISGAANKFVAGVLTNAGTATWTGPGHIYLDGPGAIYNLPSAIFDVQNNSSLITQFGLPGVFQNAGLFRKSAGSGTNSFSNTTFRNSGTLEIVTGGLNVGSQFVQTDGATLLKGGKLLASSTMSFQSGLLAGSGPVIGSVSMSGQLSPGLSPGLLQITGAYAQGAIGSYNCEIGGTNAGTAYDQVTATGPATLAGTINVLCVSNYVPALGARFEIMKFASRTGTPKFQGLDISNGLALLPVFSPTNLVLVATNTPLSASPKMNLARNGDSFWLWWPLGYGGFNVQSATNLNAPIAWSPVTPAELNRHTFQSAEPMKFFRMIQP